MDSLVLVASPDDAKTRQHYGDCVGDTKMTDVQLANNLATFVDARPELQGGTVQEGLLKYLIALCGDPRVAPNDAVKQD
jgi:hypothetical protein